MAHGLPGKFRQMLKASASPTMKPDPFSIQPESCRLMAQPANQNQAAAPCQEREACHEHGVVLERRRNMAVKQLVHGSERATTGASKPVA